MNGHRILLAEDESKLAGAIRKELENNNFTVDVAANGEAAMRFFKGKSYSIIILDINLPLKNGFELCREFRRKNKNIPILILTAMGDLDDKMDAFSAGADDYIVKPVHLSELLARIKVFLKRNTPSQADNEIGSVADLQIDFGRKSVIRAGQKIDLTAKEFALLELLYRAKGRVVPKAEISEKVWGIDFYTGTNTIEVYINFLRNKVDKPFEKKLIHTKPGFGYYLSEEE